MIDSYGATRLAARPRRPRAGGTMIDSYGEPLAQRAPPRHTTAVVGRRPFAMSNPDPIYVSANCRAAYQLKCDRVAASRRNPDCSRQSCVPPARGRRGRDAGAVKSADCSRQSCVPPARGRRGREGGGDFGIVTQIEEGANW